MCKFSAVRFLALCLFLLIPLSAFSQSREQFRGSIPETLFRPGRTESPRFPWDVVIGELGRGNASAAAFSFANSIAAALLSGQTGHPALASINSFSREQYLSALGIINPESFRIGGGREERDGSVSFLLRFIGRDFGITAEMYIRYTAGGWVFEDLLLEEARNREIENLEARSRLDFFTYERFF